MFQFFEGISRIPELRDLSVPIHENNQTIIGTLNSVIKAEYLSNLIGDIVVGQTGYCYILGLEGNIIAFKNYELVKSKWNTIEG